MQDFVVCDGVYYYQFDIVIVGVGGVGMCVVIEVGFGVKIVVIFKLYFMCLYIGVVQGGMVVVFVNVEEDFWEWYIFDIVKGGDYFVDQDVVEIFVKEVIDVVIDFENMGFFFNCIFEGKIDQCCFGGYMVEYGKILVCCVCYVVDCIGYMILQMLFQNCVKFGINFFNEFYVFDLFIVKDEVGKIQVVGVVVYDFVMGELYVFQFKVVIFVIGGFGKIFKIILNVYMFMGDGVGIVWCKGFFFEDLEFFQFYLIGFVGFGIFFIEGVCGEGVIFCNVFGEWFMECYVFMIKDFVLCDIVVCCMVQEVVEGCGVGFYKDYVLLDCMYLGVEVFEIKFFDIIEFVCMYLGVDLVVEFVLVMLIVYYVMGGIFMNNNGEVFVDNDIVVFGFYVVGECVCVLVYGVNCFGMNLLFDINVFGKWLGCNVVEYVKMVEFVLLLENLVVFVFDMFEGLCNNQGIECIVVLCKMLQDEMDKGVQVFCMYEFFQYVFGVIVEFCECYKNVYVDDKGYWFNIDLFEVVELGFLFDIVEVVVYVVQNCEESCGGYMCDDFLKCDDENYMKYIMVYFMGDLYFFDLSDYIKFDWKFVVFIKNDKGEFNYLLMERKY